MNPPDTIEIRGLRLRTFIGVPDDERAEPQELKVTVVMTPRKPFAELNDDLAETVDYAAVAGEIEALALERPRRLIETLAHEIAEFLVTRHPLVRADVLLEKFILPQTECVAVRASRVAAD